MGVVTNGMVLLVTIFVCNQIYSLLSRTTSKVPSVYQTWIELFSGKSIRAVLQGAYNNYSRTGKTYFSTDGYVMPPSLFSEVRRLPSTVLNSSAGNEDILLLARFLGPNYWDAVTFVRQNVMRSMAGQVSPVRREISSQFLKYFAVPGDRTAWKSVPIWHTTFDIMCALSTRFLIGEPLCHNEKWLKKIGEFTHAVSIESILLRKFYPSLRPFAAIFLRSAKRVRVLRTMMEPQILECLTETEEGKVVLQEREHQPGEPMMPQFVAYVYAKYHQTTESPEAWKNKIIDEVVGRILGLFFAAIDTTTITFSQVMLDVAGHPRAEYADKLRKEIKTVSEKYNGEWSYEAVSELKLLDSFIHESQRLHPIGNHLAGRKVMSPGGWTFSNGDHLPQGALIQLPIWFVQTDDAVYSNPHEFDGFRFADEKHPESTPSDKFMAFGHGNHSCPGRRFALMSLKFMVIEVLTKYEYEELPARPKDWVLGVGILPDMKAELKFRPLEQGAA